MQNRQDAKKGNARAPAKLRDVPRPLTVYSATAIVVALAACEGTWATPSVVTLSAVGGSRISGVALVNIRCVEEKERVCTHNNTSVEIQFQGLHEPDRYGALVKRGTCLQPAAVITKVTFAAKTNEPSQGILGHAFLDIPIHQFLKDGYSIALVDRKGREVACGDMRSDRFF